MPAQAAVLDPVPRAGRYVFYQVGDPVAVPQSLRALAHLVDGDTVLAGLGPELVALLGHSVTGLHPFPDFSRGALRLPATPMALLLWLRSEGGDPGDQLLRQRGLDQVLAPGFTPGLMIDAFRHAGGRDLTGYEDGTENPKGEDARAAALLQSDMAGLDGSSFMAVQQWLHDFKAFDALGQQAQDHSIGRRRSDNQELDEAPESAHVKRTAQESFDPEAFVLRRSMPWTLGAQAGLMFVAFGKSFDAFEAQMRRMAGHDDGITDALLGFSRPVSGAYFWCPPMRGDQLDLLALGL